MIKRMMAGAIVAFALVMGTMACAAASDTAPRVLIVGDSVTHGANGDFTWRYFFSKAFGSSIDLVGPNTTTRDGGTYADTTFDQDHAARWGMALWEMMNMPGPTAPRIGDLVANQNPDVIVEQLGVNDFVFMNQTPDSMIQLVREFVAEARAVKSDVDFVLGTVPQTWIANVPAYNAMLPALAAELTTSDSRVVVSSTQAYDMNVDTYDTVHPTKSGDIKIAQGMTAAMNSLGYAGTVVIEAPPVVEEPTVEQPKPIVKPTAPKLRAKAERRGWVKLTWSKVKGSKATRVWFRDVTAKNAWTPLYADLAGSRTSYRMKAFKGHRIAFKVAAVNDAGVSKSSRIVKVRAR